MDSDDILLQTSIEDRYKCFLENETDMVYGDILVESGDEQELVKYDNLNRISIAERRQYLLEELSLCAFITIMVKSELFSTGGVSLDKNLPAWQDDDLVLSIVFHSGKIFHCGKPVAMICTSGDNISAHYHNKLSGLKMLFAKYEDRVRQLGKCRVFLWKLRILLDAFGVKMQEQEEKQNIFGVFLYKILFRLLRMFLSTQFRHIYG